MRPFARRYAQPGTSGNVVGQKAARLRRALLGLTLPLAAVLLIVGEAVMPKGLDTQSSSIASTTNQVLIAGRHVARFEAASLLIIFGLAAAGLSFAAIATLAPRRGSLVATAAALIGAIALTCGIVANSTDNLALGQAAAVHPTVSVAAKMWAHIQGSSLANTLGIAYFLGWMLAIVLASAALWRSRATPRWLAVLFATAYIVSNFSSPGVPGVLQSLPFLALMTYLGLLVWRNTRASPIGAVTHTAPPA